LSYSNDKSLEDNSIKKAVSPSGLKINKFELYND